MRSASGFALRPQLMKVSLGHRLPSSGKRTKDLLRADLRQLPVSSNPYGSLHRVEGREPYALFEKA